MDGVESGSLMLSFPSPRSYPDSRSFFPLPLPSLPLTQARVPCVLLGPFFFVSLLAPYRGYPWTPPGTNDVDFPFELP